MKIAIAQINPTIGNLEGNLILIEQHREKARELGADLCVFPEMALTGYPPHDLLERSRFIERNIEMLEKLAQETQGIALIVGHVCPSNKSTGKKLQNAAALIADGKVVSTHQKMLLPTYDVFDERRYFEPADSVNIVEYGGKKLAITICEDIWNSPLSYTDNLYDRNPVAELVDQGADVIINLSASPFTLDKRSVRRQLVVETARKFKRPVILANQVGGNDDLVFDGHSLAVGPDGSIWARGSEFATDLVMVDLETQKGDVRDLAPNKEAAVIDALTLGVKDYARKCGFSTAVLGLSGGIDSALVAVIAARALGPKNVYCVAMPSRYSSQGSLEDAKALAENLKVNYQVLTIDDLFQGFLNKLEKTFEGTNPNTTEENIQARARGVLLMALSNKFGHLLLSTGNKSEMATGYCTLYGDMAGGLSVISDIPKTLVFNLCRYLNRNEEMIPQNIIDKPPSAELAPDQKDSDSLPPYEVLDGILELLVDKGQDSQAIIEKGFDDETVKRIAHLVRINEYKRRQAAPGLKVTSKAFGFGRRMPLAQRWRG